MSMTKIGSANSSDLSRVIRLLEENGLPNAGLRDHLVTLLVARKERRIVGSAALEMYGSAALLRSVATHSSMRRQGLGRSLTRAALDLARESGVKNPYLLTESAETFFAQFGFAPIDQPMVPSAVRTSAEFTTACPESAIAMALSIGALPG